MITEENDREQNSSHYFAEKKNKNNISTLTFSVFRLWLGNLRLAWRRRPFTVFSLLPCATIHTHTHTHIHAHTYTHTHIHTHTYTHTYTHTHTHTISTVTESWYL